MTADGDGWSAGPDGTKRWGRFGAAGLLIVTDPRPDGGTRKVLLQHRAVWTSNGGTWGIPGGALDPHENPVEAALRETAEETGLSADQVQVHRMYTTAGPYPKDPQRPELAGGWTYTVVFATCGAPLETVCNNESVELVWVDLDQVTDRLLLPAFADTWPVLRAMIEDLPAHPGT